MAEINVTFIHPTDSRTMTVNLDDSITAQESVAELISAQFITPNHQGYGLALKGGSMIEPAQSFRAADIQDNAAIRVVPATDAGFNN